MGIKDLKQSIRVMVLTVTIGSLSLMNLTYAQTGKQNTEMVSGHSMAGI